MSGDQFEPFVPAGKRMPELTLTAILLGSVITILFGAANAYLGLKAGLTVASSIPASILAAVFFKVVRKGTPLENNIIQTIGSTGYSLASAIIFIIPAFFLLGMDPGQFRIFLIALIGAILGVCMMIPLRQYLMVKEHGRLPYPEGVACAEVIIASQAAARKAKFLFGGLGLGFCYNLLAHPHFFGLWQWAPTFSIPGYPKAEIHTEATPELLGAGFIIGPRIASVMLAGGIFGALFLVPLLAFVGQNDPAIAAMSAGALRGKYVRMLGVGMLMTGGIFSLVRSLPIIRASLAAALEGFAMRRGGRVPKRTERDIPLPIIAGVVAALILLLMILPSSVLATGGVIGGLCVLVFGFLLSAVVARIVGLVGSSACPVSSLMIAMLIGTSAIFLALGLTRDLTAAKITILTVSSLASVALVLSQDIAQDLKTGFLVGATPAKAQIAQMLSILVSAPVMAAVIYLFKNDIVSGALPAPQANLMATVLGAMLTGDLPWGLLIGGGICALLLELIGISSLSFGIGLYLPFGISVPIGIGGGLAAWLARAARRPDVAAERADRGVLISSGYIAGGAIAGVLITALVAGEGIPALAGFLAAVRNITAINPDGVPLTAAPLVAGLGTLPSYLVFGILPLALLWAARKKPISSQGGKLAT
ncbi:MAG: oligopeptide transporter, OPT family [Deltaproteobacteria bacterium]|nr:oligopeptide transporter, OPT family [Deltaproteobacteria bacterium]